MMAALQVVIDPCCVIVAVAMGAAGVVIGGWLWSKEHGE